MEAYELKARDYYGEVVINKGLMAQAGFGARAVPVYVGEWIISQFIDGDNLSQEGREEIIKIVSTYLPQKSDKNVILNRLKEQEEVRILDDFRVNVNLDQNTHELSIPVLDVNKAMIQKGIIDENPMLLKTGMWGLGSLRYVPPDGEDVKKGQIWMVEFQPFQTPGVDLGYFKECRKHFSIDEWIDLLISSCQFNPSSLNERQKQLLLSRIIPLVQPRVNVAELAPKGTGKSFIYDNISRYAAIIPGGKLSAPALFYNKATKQIGLIPRYDVVVVDEVQKIRTDTSGEAMAGLKMYLESGRYRRATGDMGTSEAGFTMLGNITMDADGRPLYATDGIFKELPAALQESAFVDRIHGLIEGWFMDRITKDSPSKSLGFKGDFFSEVLHELRGDLQYADHVSHSMHLPHCDDMRDGKAIARLAEGYLKLLFPDMQVSENEFIQYCVNPAVRMRQQIRDELAKLDQEYKWVTIKSEKPDEFQLSHPERKPEPYEGKTAEELCALPESATLEFKSTLRWDLRQDKVSKDVQFSVIKTIAAFLNSNGGALLIGVDDTGNATGIERDLKVLSNPTIDVFQQTLVNLIVEYIGAEFAELIKISFDVVEGKQVCIVIVAPGPNPSYIKSPKGKQFFIRAGNTTRSLDPEQTVAYIDVHW